MGYACHLGWPCECGVVMNDLGLNGEIGECAMSVLCGGGAILVWCGGILQQIMGLKMQCRVCDVCWCWFV